MVKTMLGFLGVGREKKAARGAAAADTCSDAGKPLAEADYVVVDTELTGLDEKKDAIVSVGALRMKGGAIEVGETFYRLVNPAAELTAASVVIHEITPSEVVRKPAIDTVLTEFVQFLRGGIIVGHFVSIDLSFINRELRRISGCSLGSPALDTHVLYEWLSRRPVAHKAFATPLKNRTLYEVARRFDIPVSGAHNALMDAFLTAQVFQRFIPLLIESGIRTVGEVLNIGNPSKGGDAYRAGRETCNL